MLSHRVRLAAAARERAKSGRSFPGDGPGFAAAELAGPALLPEANLEDVDHRSRAEKSRAVLSTAGRTAQIRFCLVMNYTAMVLSCVFGDFGYEH